MKIKFYLFVVVILMITSCTMTTAHTMNCTGYEKFYEHLPLNIDKAQLAIIPDREVNILDFGGVGDGVAINTDAFAKAIDNLSDNGGGRLVVPAGVWQTGPITLKSKINLHAEQGAIIVFTTDKSQFPIVKTYFEGRETYRCQSPIMAVGLEDIAITGEGIIDGSGDVWRAIKKDKIAPGSWNKIVKGGGVLSSDGKMWYPSESYKLGAGDSDQNINLWANTKEDFASIKDFLRPVMIHIRDCDRVLIEGVTIQNPPSWTIHPIMSRDIIIDNISLRCPWYAQNGDGIDVESCDRVLIVNSTLDVGDDAICIKSGKDEEGRKRGIPCSNVLVDNCTVFHGHGGFVVGSEMSGGANNISVRNCRFSGTDVGLRFKSTRGRGGVVENIYISNITMNNIATEALLFDLFYGGKSASEALEEGDENEATDLAMRVADETTPEFRNITIENVECFGARRAMLFNGLPEKNVSNIKVSNVSIYSNIGAQIFESTNVKMDNIQIYPSSGPALMINNSKHVDITNFICPNNLNQTMVVTGSRNKDIIIDSECISLTNSLLSEKSVKNVEFK